jgi:hypothetical protein
VCVDVESDTFTYLGTNYRGHEDLGLATRGYNGYQKVQTTVLPNDETQ